MKRTKLVMGALLFLASSAVAQEDMTFSLDDLDEGGSTEMTFDEPVDSASPIGNPIADPLGNPADGGDLNFETIDTEKETTLSKKADMDLVRVVQRRPFLRRHRVELNPFMGTNLNDTLSSQFIAGGTLNYHLTETMGLGINAAYSVGNESDLFDELIEDYEVYPQVSTVLWYASLQFQYAPIYGKFALFNSWIIPWDIYTLIGAGYTQTELGGHPMLSVGIGQRFFMNRWFTVNIELRDNIFNENYPAESVLVNNLLVTAGLSFFIPFGFEYRTLK